MTTNFASPVPELDLAEIRKELEEAEKARSKQLAELPVPAVDDLVAILHRESVERTLADIRAALRRLDKGTYGICVRCAQPIPAGRLELRPWAETCTACASA